MNLSSAFQRVAKSTQQMFGGTGNVTVTRVAGTATTEDAVIYREKSQWRRTSSGDREQVFTRTVQLPPDSAAVPLGSTFVADSLTYTVESVNVSPASASQTVMGIRHEAASVSRPGYYGND